MLPLDIKQCYNYGKNVVFTSIIFLAFILLKCSLWLIGLIPEGKEIIRKFVVQSKECDPNLFRDYLIAEQIFTEEIWESIFSSDNNVRSKKGVCFLEIQEQKAFVILLEELIQKKLPIKKPNLTLPKKNDKVFQQMRNYEDEIQDEDISEIPKTPICTDRTFTPLEVSVTHSDQFYDTEDHNHILDFYETRSKERGRLLIINNYEFHEDVPNINPLNKYRNGATTDNENLLNLFTQMGGWDIEHYDNQTAEQMNINIHNFAQNKKNLKYDMCFLVLMSHGDEKHNDTIIYGIDGRYIFASKVQKEFNNENCKTFRGKPKVFLFQVCRGKDNEYTIKHVIETDSVEKEAPAFQLPPKQKQIITNIRVEEDILVGHSTLLGGKAHRNPLLGSWYIELLCERFMKHAHNTPLDDLLMSVDQGLKKRISEYHTVQTSEYSNRGFKKLYLHPGIYNEDNIIRTYSS